MRQFSLGIIERKSIPVDGFCEWAKDSFLKLGQKSLKTTPKLKEFK